jgi:hypothetical protein
LQGAAAESGAARATRGVRSGIVQAVACTMATMTLNRPSAALVTVLVSGLLAACGGSSSTSSSGAASPSSTAASAATTTAGTSSQSLGGNALSGEAKSAATGDIPDNQVFLKFHDKQVGYSLSYPEGWAQRGGAGSVVFQDKNNIIRVLVSHGPAPSARTVTAALANARVQQPTLRYGSAQVISINGVPRVKISYSTLSRPDPVTGKRVQLLVDRYVYFHAGKVMVLDLGTPRGVDNVDAYRMISQSVQWR